MMLQASLNQLLSMAAIGQRIAPDFDSKQKLRESNRRLKGYKQQAEYWSQYQGPRTQAEAQAEDELVQRVVEESGRRFELDPTAENFASYRQNLIAGEEFLQTGRQQQAAIEARQAQAAEQQRIQASRASARAAREAELLGNAPQSIGVRESNIQWQ